MAETNYNKLLKKLGLYRGDLAAKGSVSDWSDLAKMVLEGYNLPTTDMDEIKSYVESYLRTAYDQSIENRRKQTEADRAMIDLDAYSRGMGSSTWVTDAKQRLQDAEADDIAKMEANYQAGLNEAVLNQYNQAVAQGLAAQNNAYDLAKDLYSLGQNAKAGVGSVSSSGGSGGGGGGGGGGYSYRRSKKKSSGSRGSDSSDDNDLYIYDSTNVKNRNGSLNFANKDNRDAYYASNGYTPYYAKEGTPKKTASSNKKTNTTKSTDTSKSNRRMSGQTM